MRQHQTFWVSFWDFWVLVLVVFPLLTGGIWIERPHLFLELSDLGPGVLIIALQAAVLKGWLRQPLEKGLCLKASVRLWNAWTEALRSRPWVTLLVSTAFSGLLWSWASLARHAAMHSFAFDLGIFTNAMWNLTHGNGYVCSVKGGINLFADHQSPSFWLAAPFFHVFPSAGTLLVLQGFGLAAGAIPLFWLGRQYAADGVLVPALPLLYWLYLPLRNANAFDFHPEVLMLPWFLWAIAALQSRLRGHRVWGALALLLALGAKETAGPVAAGVGLAWCCGAGPAETRTWTRRLGFAFMALGLAAFYLEVIYLPRHWLHGEHAYRALYEQYGSSPLDMALSPLRKPGLFLLQLLGPERRKFLLWTFGGLAFAPFLAPAALIAALPGYLMLFLTAGPHRIDVHYHYVIEPGVGLFWATAVALAQLGRQRRWSLSALGWGLAFFALAASGRSELFRIRHERPDEHARWLETELLPAVAPGISLAASDSLVPHLAQRPWIHALDSLAGPRAEPVDCAISDTAVSNWPMDGAAFSRLETELGADGFREVFRCGSVAVFALPGVECLLRRPACPG